MATTPEVDRPSELIRLVELLGITAERVTLHLAEDGNWTDRNQINEWHIHMARLIAAYLMAAYLLGRGDKNAQPSPLDTQNLEQVYHSQLENLAGFADTIRHSDEWGPGYPVRARSYAMGIQPGYWIGHYSLHLPAYPGDGSTQCGNNCGCQWDIQPVDAANGDWDCYWVRYLQDSCETCVAREQAWSPFRVRGGTWQTSTEIMGLAQQA